MSKRTYVNIGPKQYIVTFPDDPDYPPNIWITWDRIVPSTCYSVHPTYNTASRSVSPYGRLGKKVLKLAAEQLAKATN